MIVPVTGYTVGDNTFTNLRVGVSYRRDAGFMVSIHPGWGDDRFWGCVFNGSKNPLTSGGSVLVEPAVRNNARKLQAMFDNLNCLHARVMISGLFDEREFKHLEGVLVQIALSGWTTAERYLETVRHEETVRRQVENGLKARISNKQNQTTMKLNLSNNKNESANAAKQQVNNNVEVHEVDLVGVIGALKTKGHAKFSDHFKDAEVVEPIGEVKAEEPKAAPKPKVALEKKQRTPKKPAPKADAKPAQYAVVLLPTKDGGQWPKLYGFANEQQAKAMADKLPNSITASWDYGPNGEGRETKTKHWCLKMGKRYCGVAKQLCDALNSGNAKAIAKAVTDFRGVYDTAKAEGQAERKAAKDNAPKAAKPKDEPKAEKKSGYSAKDVAAMLKDIIAGKDIPADVKKLMDAA